MGKGSNERFVQGTDKCDLLIVDDEPSFRLGLEAYFKQKMPDIKIKLAEDGEQAYELVSKFRPRVVWTCIRMPRMNGLTLIELIKKNTVTKNIKVIIYTAYHSAEIKNQALGLGADVYLYKGDDGQLEEGLKKLTNFLK